MLKEDVRPDLLDFLIRLTLPPCFCRPPDLIHKIFISIFSYLLKAFLKLEECKMSIPAIKIAMHHFLSLLLGSADAEGAANLNFCNIKAKIGYF